MQEQHRAPSQGRCKEHKQERWSEVYRGPSLAASSAAQAALRRLLSVDKFNSSRCAPPPLRHEPLFFPLRQTTNGGPRNGDFSNRCLRKTSLLATNKSPWPKTIWRS